MKKFLLVGNANTGKTTLFNALTKGHEHVGNWHGVTNSERVGKFKFNSEEFEVVDLPGIYSLTPLSFEEEVAINYIFKEKNAIIFNVCDENNIQRNLYLTLQLLELGAKVILVVNHMDKKPYNIINENRLSKELKIPVIKINFEEKEEQKKLKEFVSKYEKLNFNGVNALENFLKKFENFKIKKSENFPSKFVLAKILEGDEKFIKDFCFEKAMQNKIEEIAIERYNFINNLTSIKRNEKKVYGYSKIDKILLNKFFALPIFFGILLLIFYLTFFSFGAMLSDFLESFFQDKLGTFLTLKLSQVIKTAWVLDLFKNALIGGIGSVLSFLPQVLLLFLFLGLLEDSGYLSRVAFLFEDLFSKVGLSGKGVYTMLMGFGCSATAIMTTRNMEDKNAKIKTALITPYMSCSAKLPIYAVFGGAFFGAINVFVVFSLYLLGIIVAIIMSIIYEKTVLKSKEQSFILEFAQMRKIKIKRIGGLIWDNLKMFLIRIGTVIICANTIVWLLSSFSLSFNFVPETQGAKSILQLLGEILAPIFAPLGFGNWGATAALIAGIIAKEVVVSSLAIFNNVGSGNIGGLSESLKNANSSVFFTPASAISYLIFCLLYTPCIVALGVLKQEIGRKWMFFSIITQLIVAYIVAITIYSVFNFFLSGGFFEGLAIIIVFVLIIFAIFFLIFKRKIGCERCGRRCKQKTKCK